VDTQPVETPMLAHGQSPATACVLGDLDMVAPLTLAGIRCAIVAPPGDPARYSRRAEWIGWADPRTHPDDLLALLLEYASRHPERPVLYYQSDQHAQFVSRHEAQLASAFRVLITKASLLEDLLDKLRFQELAERLALPVARSQVIDPRTTSPEHCELSFPALIKPSSRGDARWADLEPARKAIRMESRAELSDIWSRLVDFGSPVLAQELIPGPETHIESYHAYLDATGGVRGEFTGKKLRTKPAEFGRSTALVITDQSDVKELGHSICQRLELRGVAKVDFKRDASGTLWLLEVNPRYTLWFHPAAKAGVNIPAMVWSDLTGHPIPSQGALATGVTWCSPWDASAARAEGLSFLSWLLWFRRCEARSMMDWRDPLPFLRLCVQRGQRFLQQRLGRHAS
jgi:predicted ATP-grasp superfamily ATP-dependent carboligase